MANVGTYQHRPVSEIIGREEANDLRMEVMDSISEGGSYEDVEDIMLGYGLEMDYLEDLLF